MIYRWVRPLLFQFDAERAHRLTIAALRVVPNRRALPDPILRTRCAGLDFPAPVGLAAGFDKDAQVPDAMLALGFGFVEVGTLTPLPQSGNSQPRLFRLARDEAVINRMGFNNGGQAAAHSRLAARERHGIIGINIGANKDSSDRIADYVAGMRTMAGIADYLSVNISSPNTPGLRGLQDPQALGALLDALDSARAAGDPPVFLKLAPDLTPPEIDAIVKVATGRVAALIIGNTTLSRDALSAPQRSESGGLSGKPLAALARARLADFRRASGGTIPLIAAGGIDSADEAYARIRAGATLVQLYTALVYHGPGLARTICTGLAALLRRDGFASVTDAIGVDA